MVKKYVRHASLLLALFVSFLIAPSLASAATFYMSPTGSDSGSGSITAPWRTVSASSGKLTPGDTLYARGGTYTGQTGQSWNSPSGTASAPITWKAYPGETPIFDGQNAEVNFLNIIAKDWLILDGMTIKNYRGCCGSGIWIGGAGAENAVTDYATNNAIRNMTMLDLGGLPDGTYVGYNEHAIYVSLGNVNLEISGNTILRTSGAAIHGYHDPACTGCKVFNNVIDGLGGGYVGSPHGGTGKAEWGIVGRNWNNAEIYNNTVLNNYYDIDVIGSTNVTIRNNIVSKPLTLGSATCSNNFYTSGTPNCGTSNFTGSAGFVNAGANDYHLQSTSAAINKGTTVSLVTKDKDGVTRPQGSAYDIGAYEYASVPPPPPPPSSSTLIETGGTTPYTDTGGKVWQADQYFTGGSAVDRGAIAIANTVDDRIYQTERYNMTGYAIPVANGTYTVKLHFAETSPGITAGQRVFNVSLEGAAVLSNFDVYAEAGPNTALIKTFTTTVSDGVLNVGFSAVTASPEVNGIEITLSSPDTTPPTTPGTPVATNITSTSLTLNWTASTDNIGVTGYRLERCTGSGCTTFTQVASPTTNSYSDTTLSPLTTYTYRVRSADGAGNTSAYSGTVTATTAALGITTTSIAGTVLVTVSLVPQPSDASVYYTTDGTTPTQSSTLYSVPFTVTTGTNVKARAFKTGYTAGPAVDVLNSSTLPSATGIAIGSNIKTTDYLNVRTSASLTAPTLGVQPINATGVIIGGPVTSGGHTWWQVNYTSGPDGWSVQDWMVGI